MTVPEKINDALRRMSTVSATALGEVSLQRRYDTKYVCGEGKILEILELLGDEYAVVVEDERVTATYQTVYFDTQDMRCFHDHRRGRRSRYKIRIRRYPERALAFFEVKEKTNRDQTRKMRLERPVDADPGFSPDEAQVILDNTPFDPASLNSHLTTRFRRFTLVDDVRKERVTVDLNLEFTMAEDRRVLPGLVIVEVKQRWYSRMSPVMRALRSLGVRPLRVSKYCTGNALFSVDRSTGFYKEKLRRMEMVGNG